jgi:hypothetical protein
MGRWKLSRGLAAIVAFSGPFFLASAAEPATVLATPSLSIEESWDSNIFNTSSDETSDFVTRARPMLALSFQVLRTSMTVSGGFEFEKYLDNDELDSIAATKDFNLTTADPIQITTRFSLRPSARYVETTDWVRRDVLGEAPTLDLPPSETVVRARTEVTEISGVLNADYLVTQNLSLAVGGGARRREHDDPGRDLVDSTVVTGSAGLGYRYSPRLLLGPFIEASHNSFEEEPSSDIFTGGLRGRYALTPNHTLDGRVGGSYTERRSDDPAGDETRKWAPHVRLSLVYAWRTFRAALTGSYELAGGGSFGRTTERATVSIALSERLTERLTIDLSGTYQNNTAIDEPATDDFATANGRIALRYRAAEWLFLTLSGNVFRQWADGLAGEDIDRHAVMIGALLRNSYRFTY